MALNLSISTVRILDDHAEYGVSCGLITSSAGAGGGARQVVWRRYRDFEQLRQTLSHSINTYHLPLLPPKYSWWTSRSAPVVNDRQRMFEGFLKELETTIPPNTNGWLIFCAFVGVSATTAAVSASSASTNGGGSLLEDELFVRIQDENARLKTSLAMLEEEDKRLKEDLARREAELQSLRTR